MNAAGWFAGQSFCGRPIEEHYVCESRKDGGAYIVSFFGADASAKAQTFRREQESYGCTVTVRRVSP